MALLQRQNSNQGPTQTIFKSIVLLITVGMFFLIPFTSCDLAGSQPTEGVEGPEDESAAIRTQLEQLIADGEDVADFDTSKITDMSNLFKDNTGFNQDISGWDVSSVTDHADFSYGCPIHHTPKEPF